MHTVKKKVTPKAETEWVDFDVSIGIRIRLTNEQKLVIKDAYDNIAAGQVEQTSTSTRGGLSVSHGTAPNRLILDLGMDRTTLGIVLAGNDRHTVGTIRRFERVLGIELLNKKQLDEAWKSYLKHIGF